MNTKQAQCSAKNVRDFLFLCEHARLYVPSRSNFSGRNAASSVIGYEMLYTHFF